MTGKTITVTKAEELLREADIRGIIPEYDEREDDWALRRVGGTMASDIGRCYAESTARLLAAAPDLARTAIKQSEIIDGMAEEWGVQHDTAPAFGGERRIAWCATREEADEMMSHHLMSGMNPVLVLRLVTAPKVIDSV